MARRRRKPSDAARPQPARPPDARAAVAAGVPADGTSRASRRDVDGPMQSVYMLAVLYAITLEAVRDLREFTGSAAGEARADTGAGQDTQT